MVWTDDEVQLLLETLINLKREKSYEGIDWEPIKEKYEIIRKKILTAFPSEANKEFSHDKSLFTRERISSKIKQTSVKYRKVLDSGRQSGGDRVVAIYSTVYVVKYGQVHLPLKVLVEGPILLRTMRLLTPPTLLMIQV